MLPNEFDDFQTAFFGYSNALSDSEHVINGRLAVSVDRSGVFTVITFGYGGQLVGRCEMPMAFAADEAEVLGVVVFVVGEHVEGHQSKHGFYLLGVLSQKTSEVQ